MGIIQLGMLCITALSISLGIAVVIAKAKYSADPNTKPICVPRFVNVEGDIVELKKRVERVEDNFVNIGKGILKVEIVQDNIGRSLEELRKEIREVLPFVERRGQSRDKK